MVLSLKLWLLLHNTCLPRRNFPPLYQIMSHHNKALAYDDACLNTLKML